MSRYGTQPDRASFDAEVARRHAAGRDDLVTAFALGVHPKTPCPPAAGARACGPCTGPAGGA
jgi:hypothetical protein